MDDDAREVELWRQARALFEEAVELPPEEREPFLRGRTDGQEELRRAVERLLAHDRETTSLGEAPLRPSLLEPGLSPGDRLGGYRLLEEIGRGGHGVVFRAERAGADFRQQVAVKVLRGFLSHEAVERFRRERRILASLEHPQVARLIDGGQSPEGIPYVVMELVEGEPVTVACDRRLSPLDERIRLFSTACEAVESAHRASIIHRDLKPANLLLTEEGRVKLLDFGIAKLLAGAVEEVAAEGPAGEVTRGFCLSPAYASPEQKEGGPVTAASDVYSLGVVLFELLTGRRPLAGSEPELLASETVGEAPEDADTARARGLAHARQLRRALAGDLDAILRRATAASPEDRYPTAAGLAADLRRSLEGLPVEARRGAYRYRAGRFLRRHAVAASLTAVVLATGAVASAQAYLQAERLRQEQTAAERQRQRGEAMEELSADLLEILDPYGGAADAPLPQELLDSATERILQRFEGEPQAQALLLAEAGGIYRRTGRYEEAEAVLRRALGLARETLGERSPEVATCLNELGRTLAVRGREEGESLLRQALALRRELLPENDPAIAASLVHLAEPLRVRGEVDEAETLLREAIAIDRFHGPEATDDSLERLEALALLLAARKEYAQARDLFQAQAAQSRELFGDEDLRLADALNNLGAANLALADLAAAEGPIRESLEIRRRRLEPEHPVLGLSVNNLAIVLSEHGEWEEATELYREVVAIDVQGLGEEHPTTAIALNNLAHELRDQGRIEEARAYMERALAARRASLAPEDPALRLSLLRLAETVLEEGDLERAGRLLGEAFQRLPPGERPGLKAGRGDLLYGRAVLAQARGSMEEAEELAREAREIFLEAEAGEPWRTAEARNLLAVLRAGRSAIPGPELAAELLGTTAEVCTEAGPWTFVFRRTARRTAEALRRAGLGLDAQLVEGALAVDLSTVTGTTIEERAEERRRRVCAPLGSTPLLPPSSPA